MQKNNVNWLNSKYFKRTLKQNLNKDCQCIIKMIELCGQWKTKEDQKLNELYKLVTETYPKDKIVLFSPNIPTPPSISAANSARRMWKADRTSPRATARTPPASRSISPPVSNEKSYPADQQSRILIATDVLSEGQNLRDAHIIINYDLPWAIIRLIQRAGRVIVSGSRATTSTAIPSSQPMAWNR